MVTADVKLPPLDELKTDEIKVSSPVLRALGTHMGYACDQLGKVFCLFCFLYPY